MSTITTNQKTFESNESKVSKINAKISQSLIETIQWKRQSPKCDAIGIRPMAPTLFYDIDMRYLNEPEMNIITKEIRNSLDLPNNINITEIQELNDPLEQIRQFIQYKERQNWYATNQLYHYHNAIYKTKHGYHLVQQMKHYDAVQESLWELKAIFPRSNYILNCRKLRLRISPKWIRTSGMITSPEPYLFEHCKCDIWNNSEFTKLKRNGTNSSIDLREGLAEMYSTYD